MRHSFVTGQSGRGQRITHRDHVRLQVPSVWHGVRHRESVGACHIAVRRSPLRCSCGRVFVHRRSGMACRRCVRRAGRDRLDFGRDNATDVSPLSESDHRRMTRNVTAVGMASPTDRRRFRFTRVAWASRGPSEEHNANEQKHVRHPWRPSARASAGPRALVSVNTDAVLAAGGMFSITTLNVPGATSTVPFGIGADGSVVGS